MKCLTLLRLVALAPFGNAQQVVTLTVPGVGTDQATTNSFTIAEDQVVTPIKVAVPVGLPSNG